MYCTLPAGFPTSALYNSKQRANSGKTGLGMLQVL